MKSTLGYLVVLFLGTRVELGWQTNCEKVGVTWLDAAIAWQERNDLHGSMANLLYMCVPPEDSAPSINFASSTAPPSVPR